MILVDSSVWIDYFRGIGTPQTDRLDVLLGTEPLAIGELILAEILQGFSSERDAERAMALLGALEPVDIDGQVIVVLAARHYRMLRGRGVTVRKTVDTLIATRCIHNGITPLYSDRNFDPFA